MISDNNYEEADQYVSRALRIDDSLPDAIVCMGRILEKKGKVDEAVKYYERSIKLQ